jgi:hypothetical protein
MVLAVVAAVSTIAGSNAMKSNRRILLMRSSFLKVRGVDRT